MNKIKALLLSMFYHLSEHSQQNIRHTWHWVWNQVRPVAYKEIIHMMNDPATIRIAILLPLIQMMLFGYAINMEVENVPTVIYNEDQRPASQELIDGLGQTTYMKVNKVALSKQELIDQIRRGRSQVGVVIPPDYSDKLAQGQPSTFQVLVDGSDSNIATQVLSVATQYASVSSQRKLDEQGQGSVHQDQPIQAATHVLYNPDLRTQVFTIPGLLGVVLLNTTLFLTVLSLVREREYGTMDQLLVTPLTPSGLIVGKIAPYVLLGLFDFNLVLAAMVFLFQVPIAGSLWLLELCAFLFLSNTLGIGLLISARSSNQLQAAQISQLIILPSILLSGFAFSIQAMPAVMQFVSHTMPMTYFLEVLRGIILRGANLYDLLFPIGMMVLLGFTILISSIISFKRQMS